MATHVTTTSDAPPIKQYLAHVRQDKDGAFIIHNLEEHLRAVANLAGKFASVFGDSDWGYLAGLWHDLGKYAKEFQRRIKSVSGYDSDAHLEGSVGRVMVGILKYIGTN